MPIWWWWVTEEGRKKENKILQISLCHPCLLPALYSSPNLPVPCLPLIYLCLLILFPLPYSMPSWEASFYMWKWGRGGKKAVAHRKREEGGRKEGGGRWGRPQWGGQWGWPDRRVGRKEEKKTMLCHAWAGRQSELLLLHAWIDVSTKNTANIQWNLKMEKWPCVCVSQGRRRKKASRKLCVCGHVVWTCSGRMKAVVMRRRMGEEEWRKTNEKESCAWRRKEGELTEGRRNDNDRREGRWMKKKEEEGEVFYVIKGWEAGNATLNSKWGEWALYSCLQEKTFWYREEKGMKNILRWWCASHLHAFRCRHELISRHSFCTFSIMKEKKKAKWWRRRRLCPQATMGKGRRNMINEKKAAEGWHSVLGLIITAYMTITCSFLLPSEACNDHSSLSMAVMACLSWWHYYSD